MIGPREGRGPQSSLGAVASGKPKAASWHVTRLLFLVACCLKLTAARKTCNFRTDCHPFYDLFVVDGPVMSFPGA